jgi:predicted nucleotidyltransferase component of viral defense system
MKEKKDFAFLLPETVKVLEFLIKSAPFSYTDYFDKKEILDVMKSIKSFEIINETKDQIDLLLEGVKVTFFNAKWEFLEPDKIESFNLASLESIAAMKINVLFLRAKFRDYYDLFFLAKEKMTLNEIFEQAKIVIAGITYKLFCIALTYIDDLEDDSIAHLDPIISITKDEIRAFFENKIRDQL